MKPVEYWNWYLHRPYDGKRYQSRYKMPEAEALATDTKAERVPGSMEVRQIPETDQERGVGWAGRFGQR